MSELLKKYYLPLADFQTGTRATGSAPVASFMHYNTTFTSFKHGKGVLNLRFSGYDRCHNEAAVIKRIAYNK